MKVYVSPLTDGYPQFCFSIVDYYDESTMLFVWQKLVILPKDNSITSADTAIAFIKAAAYTEATSQGYTITDADFICNWPINGLPSLTRTFTNPTRSLNSAFQISTTQVAAVSYAVDVAATLSLTTGQTGTVVLEYADDMAFTTNVKTVQSSINGNAGTLAIGLGLTQTATATLTGVIPVGKYVRLRTVNTVGTPTFTFRTAQEVLSNN